MSWFWLSFADPDKPEGEQFLGVVILEADHARMAHMESFRLRLNPGGEMLAFEIEDPPAESFRNRLLTRMEASMLSEVTG